MINVINLVNHVMYQEMKTIINVLNVNQHMKLKMIQKLIIIVMKNVLIIIIMMLIINIIALMMKIVQVNLVN